MSKMLREVLLRRFLDWLEEDAPFWDVTTEALIPRGLRVKAVVIAKSSGIIACTEDVFSVLEPLGVKVKEYLASGTQLSPGTIVAEMEGEARTLLVVERTLLNLLMYLSGVATITRAFVEKARKVNPRVRVAATRKTLPGLRALTKRAVAIGGGDTHRLSLSDAILIKDNHIALVSSVAEAVKLAKRKASFAHKVEVEVTSVEDAVEAVRAGADVVMLDNMGVEEVRLCIEKLKELGLRDRVIVEASGGITLDNVEDYAATGVDVISTSAITLRPARVDLSMEVVRN